ncbi:hypothetical protein HZS_3434 [Henneguya salminicola]|nr:hypothetical protein HZS_3434 [Henneguya salminicola]
MTELSTCLLFLQTKIFKGDIKFIKSINTIRIWIFYCRFVRVIKFYATILNLFSINVVEDIIVPCGSSFNISIEEDPSSWVSTGWEYKRRSTKSYTMLIYNSFAREYIYGKQAHRENCFILDYGAHYLSLYQMSIMLNNSMITFTSYSKKKRKGEILFSKEFKIIITGKDYYNILNEK